MNYKNRTIESEIDRYFDVFSIVSITGPRQAGKSTLIKHYIDDEWTYFSLDDQALLLRIKDDPELFIRSIKTNVVIDEAQKAPSLFHSLKRFVDDNNTYKVIISGSANFLLMKSITESLAGRVGLLELLPYSLSEAMEKTGRDIIEEIFLSSSVDEFKKYLDAVGDNRVDDNSLQEFIFNGGYPGIYNLSSGKHRKLWFQNYLSTYLERDVRSLAQIGDLDTFQRVYRMSAFQTGNVLNMSSFAANAGVSVQTIKKYMSILQTSYQCNLLPSYHFNQTKQITKAPKIFYFDTGLVNFIMGNSSIDQMMNSRQWGAIVETFVFSQLYKKISFMDNKPSIYYWRTNNKAEVDFVLEFADKLIPIAVKSGMQLKKQSILGLKSFTESQPLGKVPFSIVFYGGDEIYLMDKSTIVIPLKNLLL